MILLFLFNAAIAAIMVLRCALFVMEGESRWRSRLPFAIIVGLVGLAFLIGLSVVEMTGDAS